MDRAESEVSGVEGLDPAGLLPVSGEGTVLVGYTSRGQAVRLEAEKFEIYLHEEGLEWVSHQRSERGRATAPGRERFLRSAKLLLGTVRGEPAGFDRVLGLPVELVPETDPRRLQRSPLAVRLLVRGRPRGKVLVRAISQARPGEILAARTDDQGLVHFELEAVGRWLIKAVVMEPAIDDAEADWRSWWSSLTFDVSSR